MTSLIRIALTALLIPSLSSAGVRAQDRSDHSVLAELQKRRQADPGNSVRIAGSDKEVRLGDVKPGDRVVGLCLR
jgi:hypothetical protein